MRGQQAVGKFLPFLRPPPVSEQEALGDDENGIDEPDGDGAEVVEQGDDGEATGEDDEEREAEIHGHWPEGVAGAP